MPRIELIDPVLYGPNDPYHWDIDNRPLEAILNRLDLVNYSVDNMLEQIRDAIGTQGSLANRLNQSIAQDGSLKDEAIDEALHSIEEHTDTDNYVRMTKAQSEKLDNVAVEATDLKIQVNLDGSNDTVLFDAGTLIIEASSSVTPIIISPNRLKFNMAFPEEAAHEHYYGLTPVDDNISTPDYTNYKTTSVSTPFVEGSLRVYVNGLRIYQDVAVYAPGADVNDSWTALSFTPNHTGGTFELSTAISEDDVIKIDFDISLS